MNGQQAAFRAPHAAHSTVPDTVAEDSARIAGVAEGIRGGMK